MNTSTMIAMTIALGMAVSSAQAQTTILTPEKPFRVSIGTYNPTSGGTRTAMGATLPMISLSYDVGKSTAEKPTIAGVYFDYAQNNRHGTTNSVTAFGVSARYLSRAPVTHGRFFAGAGIGSYSVKIGNSNSKIGGKLFGGYELNDGYFGEITYHMINKVHGNDPSALAFSVGRRF